MYWWFRSHAEDEHLAQVGVGPDGAMYCICRQADGSQSVVHLGSAGDTLKVLAANMWEFLVLLAIGYGELGCDELAERYLELSPQARRELGHVQASLAFVGVPARASCPRVRRSSRRRGSPCRTA